MEFSYLPNREKAGCFPSIYELPAPDDCQHNWPTILATEHERLLVT